LAQSKVKVHRQPRTQTVVKQSSWGYEHVNYTHMIRHDQTEIHP